MSRRTMRPATFKLITHTHTHTLQVSERPGELERCEATVEIRKDGSVVTFFEGRELVSEFLFKERQWPRSCIIEVGGWVGVCLCAGCCIRRGNEGCVSAAAAILTGSHSHVHVDPKQFEAKAFQGPYDREPQLMFYKGYVKRGLVNSRQVRIEGKIYDVKGTFL